MTYPAWLSPPPPEPTEGRMVLRSGFSTSISEAMRTQRANAIAARWTKTTAAERAEIMRAVASNPRRR